MKDDSETELTPQEMASLKRKVLGDLHVVRDGEQCAVVQVTPEWCAHHLGSALDNRNLSRPQVQALCENVLRGRFALTGNALSFDCEGKMADGQHRASAIVMADKPVTALVLWGLTKAGRDATDISRARSIQDQLRINYGVVNTKYKVPYMRICIRLLELPSSAVIRSAEDFFDWSEVFGDSIDWAISMFPKTTASNSTIAGALAFAHSAFPEQVSEFAECLLGLRGTKKGSHVWLFSQWHQKILSGSVGYYGDGKKGRKYVYHNLLNCLEAHVNESKKKTNMSSSPKGALFFCEIVGANPKVEKLARPWQRKSKKKVKAT